MRREWSGSWKRLRHTKIAIPENPVFLSKRGRRRSISGSYFREYVPKTISPFPAAKAIVNSLPENSPASVSACVDLEKEVAEFDLVAVFEVGVVFRFIVYPDWLIHGPPQVSVCVAADAHERQRAVEVLE